MSIAAPPPVVSPSDASSTVKSGADKLIDDRILEACKALWWAELVRAILRLVILTLGVVFVWVVVDQWVYSPGTSLRVATFAGLVFGLLWYLSKQVIPLLGSSIRPEYAARSLERDLPELRHSLTSYVTLRGDRDTAGLRSRVVRSIGAATAGRLRSHDELPAEATGTLRWWIATAIALAVLVGYSAASPKNALQSAARLAAPLASIDPARRVSIRDVQPGDIEAIAGRALNVSAVIRGMHGDEEALCSWDLPSGRQQIVLSDDPKSGRYSGKLWLPHSASGEVDYVISAGDGKAGPFRLRVQDVPVVALESVAYEPPKYTGQTPHTSSSGAITALDLTRVTIRATTNRSVARAIIEFNPRAHGELIQATAGATEMQIASSGTSLSISFPLRSARGRSAAVELESYRIKVWDAANQSNPEPIIYPIRVVADLPPDVSIMLPVKSPSDVPIDAQQAIEVHASDPDFGLKQIGLEIRSGIDVVAQPILWGEPQGAKGNHVTEFRFRPTEHGLRIGDTVQIIAVATDNRSIEGDRSVEPNVTRTDPIELKIIASEPLPKESDPDADGLSSPDERPASDHRSQEQDSSDAESGQEGESQSGEGQSDEGQSGEGQSGEGQSGEGQSGEGQSGEGQSGEGQSGEGQSGEGKSGEGQSGEGQSDEGQSGEGQSGEGQSGEGQSGEGQSGEGKSGDGQSGEGKSGDGQSGEGKSGDGQSGEGKSDDGQSGGTGKENSGGGQSGEEKSGGGQSGDAGEGKSGGSEPGGGDSRQSDTQGGESPASSEGSSDSSRPGESADDAQGNSDSATADPSGQEGGSDAAGSDQDTADSGPPKHDGDAFERIRDYLEQLRKQQQEGGDSAGEKSPAGSPNEQSGADQNATQNDSGNSPRSSSGDSSDSASADQETSDAAQQGSGAGSRESDQEQGGSESAEAGAESSPAGGGKKPGEETKAGEGSQGAGEAEQQGSADDKQDDPQQESGGNDSQTGETGSAQDAESQRQEGQKNPSDADKSGSSASQNDRDPTADSSSGQSGKSKTPDDQSAEKQASPNGKPTTSGGAPPSDSGAPTGGPADGDGQANDSPIPPDPVNVDYAKRATDMVLDYLDQTRDAPDRELLDKLNWTEDDLKRFSDRWQKVREMEPTSKPDSAANRELAEALESLGLRPPSEAADKVRESAGSLRKIRDAGNRKPPPATYRDAFDAFRRAVGRQ